MQRKWKKKGGKGREEKEHQEREEKEQTDRMGMVFDAWKEFNELLYTNIELTELRKLREEITKIHNE